MADKKLATFVLLEPKNLGQMPLKVEQLMIIKRKKLTSSARHIAFMVLVSILLPILMPSPNERPEDGDDCWSQNCYQYRRKDEEK